MVKKRNVDFTTGVIWKLLVVYFLPILAGSLFQQMYTMTDAIILGQFAGREGLSAIDSVYNLLKLPVKLLVGLSTGATIIISQYFGARNEDALSKAVHTAVLFAFGGGLILSVVGVILAPFCLHLLEVPGDIYELTLGYVRICFAGLAVSMLYNIGAGILRAVGDSQTPFYALTISSIINIVLDLVFVGVLGMSARGAALSTVLAQAISACWILHGMSKNKSEYQLHFSKLRCESDVVKSMITIGVPIALQSSLYPIANMMIQSSINRTGTDNIAAWALCGKMDFMVWLIVDSLAAAISTFVAQNYGAKQYSRARNGVTTGIIMTAGLIIIISGSLYIWCEPLGHLFMNAEDWDVVLLSGEIMRYLSPLYVLYVFGEIYSGAVRGTGKSFEPMLISLVSTCATRVLWILFVVTESSSIMVILSCFPVSWGMTSLAFFIYYNVLKKKILPLNLQ